MRSLGVCAMLLALAAVAPAPAARGPFEPLWALGTLVLLAITLQNVFNRMRLPAVSAWVVAGVILGPSLLRTVEPLRVPLLSLSFDVAGVCAGLLVGLGADWPAARRGWRLPLVIGASTLLTFGVVAVGVSAVTDLPLQTALIIAAIASLWGPMVADFWHNREAQVIALIGTAVAMVLLSLVVSGFALPGGRDWLLLLWLAPIAGAITGELLWRSRLLQSRAQALASLAGLTIVAALAAQHLNLLALPLGLGVGMVLSARQGSDRQLERLLAPARPLAILLCTGLLVASTDPAALLWPVPAGLVEILCVQVVALVLIRAIAPALWYPLPLACEFTRRSGWLLLPRGLMSGEVILAAGATFPALLAGADAALLQAVVCADLFIFLLPFAVLAALTPPPPAAAPVVTEIAVGETVIGETVSASA